MVSYSQLTGLSTPRTSKILNNSFVKRANSRRSVIRKDTRTTKGAYCPHLCPFSCWCHPSDQSLDSCCVHPVLALKRERRVICVIICALCAGDVCCRLKRGDVGPECQCHARRGRLRPRLALLSSERRLFGNKFVAHKLDVMSGSVFAFQTRKRKELVYQEIPDPSFPEACNLQTSITILIRLHTSLNLLSMTAIPALFVLASGLSDSLSHIWRRSSSSEQRLQSVAMIP